MPRESKSLKAIIHYGIKHAERDLKLKPYRKIVFRILNTHEQEFRKLLSIPDEQQFKVETAKCDMEKYDWEGCPEFEVNEDDIYRIHPHCQFIFYTENHYNSFIEKSGLTISKKAKTYWYPNEPDRTKIIEQGTYFTFEKCNPEYPIYIPTYQRHETCYTARTLEDLDIKNYYLVIRNEPDEITNYRNAIDKFKLNCTLLIMPDNFYQDQKRQGNDYSVIPRNYAYQHAIETGHTAHWCIDDNIKGFFRRNNGSILEFKNTGFPLYFVEQYIKKYDNVYQAGIQYRHLGFSMGHRNPIIYNSRIYSCILNRHIDGFRWRGKYNEDTDLSLRLLKAGYSTMTFQNVLCGKFATASVKGGNNDAIYKTETGFQDKVNELKERHPEITEIVIKYNRPHHIVDYSGFKNNKLGRNNYELNLPELYLLEDD
jgi:hypothetical protein